jgi:hypothetical protein
MSEIKSNIAALSTQMAAIMEEVKRNRIYRYRAQSRSPSPRKGDKQGCFEVPPIPYLPLGAYPADSSPPYLLLPLLLL